VLLLVTILLVAIGAISLVIGYAQSSLVPIYVSIGCSVVAAAVLLVFSRMTAKSQKSDSAGGSSGLDFDPAQPAPQRESAMAGTGGRGSASSEAFAPEDEPSYGTATQAVKWDGGDDDDFPIDGYDSRRVGEILPLLAELDVDELDIVREHEEGGKGRATVLARIDQLIEQLEADDRYEAENRDGDERGTESFKAATDSSQLAGAAVLPADDGYFPIEDYDDLRAGEILPLLPELDDDELEMVNEREEAGSARSSILHKIEELLEISAAAPPTVPAEIFEPEPEPEPESEPEPETVATSAILPDGPAKRARATKPASGRSSKASTAKSSTSKAAAGPRPTRSPAKVAKAPTSVGRAPTKAAKSPARAVKTPAKAVKAAAVPTRSAPVKKAPSGKRTVVAAKVPAVKATPAKRAQKSPAGPSSTPAAKSTKRAAKR